MLFQTLILLIAFAAVFAVTAGLARDSQFLVPMAGILILVSGMLLTSGTLLVQDGYTEQIAKDTNSTSFTEEGGGPFGNDQVNATEETDEYVDHTPRYEDLNELYDIGPLSISGLLAFIFLAIALYSFILSAKRKQ